MPRGRRNGNVVIVASDAPLPLDAMLRRAASGAAQGRLLVEERLTEFVGRAEPRTDPEDAGPAGSGTGPSGDDESGVPDVVPSHDEVR